MEVIDSTVRTPDGRNLRLGELNVNDTKLMLDDPVAAKAKTIRVGKAC